MKVRVRFFLRQLAGHFFDTVAFLAFPSTIRLTCHKMRGVKVRHAFIGRFVALEGEYPELIEIGDGAVITQGTTIMCHGRNIDIPHYPNKRNMPMVYGSVKIGRRVYIGCNCTILPDVVIEEGSVIGAGAVVVSGTHIPAYEVWAGVPARFVRKVPRP